MKNGCKDIVRKKGATTLTTTDTIQGMNITAQTARILRENDFDDYEPDIEDEEFI